MTQFGNIKVIQGDANKGIGDTGGMIWEKDFDMDNPSGSAIIMLMVKGLTATESTVDVKINNKSIGKIFPYTDGNPDHWFTQVMNVGSGHLKNGSNELQIEAVSHSGARPGNIFDDFTIRLAFFEHISG